MSAERARPVVIGLTGGIGAGKSNVLDVLVSLGAEGIDADRVAHEVMAPGAPAHAPVIAAFGPEVRGPNGEIDRGRLGARVFSDPAALKQLEAIVHPAVAGVIRQRAHASAAPLVVIEAIKLLEAGLSRALCDQVWVTQCSQRRQLARLAASRGMSAEEARRRMAAQMPAAQMAAQADRVIDTNGTRAETGLQVVAGWVALGLPLPPPEVRVAEVVDAEGIAAVLNAVVREGGLTAIDRTYTPAAERAFLRRLPKRALVAIAQLGRVTAGFQVVEPYATYTRAMDHVATVGTYVAAPARGHGLGAAMSALTFARARAAGFEKLVAGIRADNATAQAFYERLGFRRCGRLARQVSAGAGQVDQLLYEFFL